MSAILEHPNDIQSSIIASIPNGQPPEQYFNRVHVASLAYKARTVDAEREGWQNPSPLHDPLPKVAAFNASLLPEVLRAWVMDIANRMQCPPDYPAVAALVALSSLIGAKAVYDTVDLAASGERIVSRSTPRNYGTFTELSDLNFPK